MDFTVRLRSENASISRFRTEALDGDLTEEPAACVSPDTNLSISDNSRVLELRRSGSRFTTTTHKNSRLAHSSLSVIRNRLRDFSRYMNPKKDTIRHFIKNDVIKCI